MIGKVLSMKTDNWFDDPTMQLSLRFFNMCKGECRLGHIQLLMLGE